MKHLKKIVKKSIYKLDETLEKNSKEINIQIG
jgi:hypothetical protein